MAWFPANLGSLRGGARFQDLCQEGVLERLASQSRFSSITLALSLDPLASGCVNKEPFAELSTVCLAEELRRQRGLIYIMCSFLPFCITLSLRNHLFIYFC